MIIFAPLIETGQVYQLISKRNRIEFLNLQKDRPKIEDIVIENSSESEEDDDFMVEESESENMNIEENDCSF
jgi:hypothetical protein